MSNILNFLWYFLCIPAIYKCILAYLSIFFNQLSKFLRCESPSTFLGTCLSHHSFIIFLVTNTNTLLSGLYLISTVPLQKPRFYAVSRACFCRYLSEYSDNSCFSCMLTFWTYLMRCTYPWHWIKYSTNYNRCHPIFSLSWQVELSSNTLSSRAAAQTPLHKMYTFVYRTFIKFILPGTGTFCVKYSVMLLFNSIGNVSYRPAGTTSVPPPSDSMRVTAAENASVHPRSSVFLSSYSLMLIISSFSIFLFYLSVFAGDRHWMLLSFFAALPHK